MAKENDNTLVNKIMEPIKILVNTAPSREKFLARNLNFSPSGGSSDDDLCDTLPAKPKSVRGSTEILMPEKRLRTKSTTDTLLPEAKRLKVDVIVAKAQISRLETKLNEQHIISSEMQILFEKENSSLLDQHKRDEKALADMKERLQIVLRKEKHLEEDHSEALKEIRNSKLQWDTQKAGLQKLIADLKDKLSEANMSSKGQLSKMKRDMEKLQQALESEQSEVKMLKQEITRLTDRAKQCTSLRTQLEKQTFELQQVTNKLKALEYERDSFRDWQQQTKTAENRLSNMANLEKEVTRLKSSEKTLQDAVCNKLLLEEHVLSLTSRVENLQSIQQELHETNVKLSSLESSLEEWKNAARKHGVESVNALTSTLESSLHDQLIAAASSSEVQSQKAQLTEELATVKYERDQLSAKLDDILNICKNQQSYRQRLQKRLQLITRDRDSYKQKLECFEQGPPISSGGDNGIGSKALLSDKVARFEKTLQGYRDLLAVHDKDSDVKALDTDHLEVNKWREEAESAHREANKLRMQRDNLQAHIERLAAPFSSKNLQIPDNPSTAAFKQMQVDVETALDEIKILKAAQKDGASTLCPEEKQQLEQQLQHSQNELKRIQEESKSIQVEQKYAMLLLFGYAVERTGTNSYKITNMYAESDNDCFTLTITDDDVKIQHLNHYANCTELMQLHLRINKSIPLFFSALTTELFTKHLNIESNIELNDPFA